MRRVGRYAFHKNIRCAECTARRAGCVECRNRSALAQIVATLPKSPEDNPFRTQAGRISPHFRSTPGRLWAKFGRMRTHLARPNLAEVGPNFVDVTSTWSASGQHLLIPTECGPSSAKKRERTRPWLARLGPSGPELGQLRHGFDSRACCIKQPTPCSPETRCAASCSNLRGPSGTHPYAARPISLSLRHTRSPPAMRNPGRGA